MSRPSRTSRAALVISATTVVALTLTACQSSSTSSESTPAEATAAAATSAAAEASAEATMAASASADASAANQLGTCNIDGCDVYGEVDFSTLEGKTVGVMDLVPVPGSTRYTEPLRQCIKDHGGTTLDVDVVGDVTKVPGVLNGWIAQGVDAIAELGVALDGSQDVLDAAAAAGIPIISWGAAATPGMITINADQFKNGVLQAEHVMTTLPDGGSVLSLRNDTNPGLTARAEGFKAKISENPAFTLVEKQVPELTSEASNTLVTSYLQGTPDTVAIQAGFGDWALGVVQAVRQSGSKAIVTSANGDPSEYEEMAKADSPFSMTMADGHEFGAQLTCETIAVILGGGEVVDESVYVASNVVTQDNVPTGGVDTTPRAVTSDAE